METDYKTIAFSPILRKEILIQFNELCRDEYTEFMKIFMIFSKVDNFLVTKCKEDDNSSREYFTRIMNIRVKDHFSSAIILVSQGYTVDALSLTRASLEDLFVLLNFYIEPGYFDKWKANKSSFNITPGELRSHPKIDKYDRDLYKKVYKALSNGIVHPRVNSLSHMLRFHPTAHEKGSEGIIRLKKDTKLINLSFFIYLHNVCTLFKTEYPNTTDVQNLVSLIDQLKSIEIIKHFGDHPQEFE